MQEVVDECNKSFGHIEQVKKFTLLPLEWSIAGGEMTPKLSMKRKFIEKKYENEIAAMYLD